MFCAGFGSGLWGGSVRGASGRPARASAPCPPAPSSTTSACAPGVTARPTTARPISARCGLVASAWAQGMTRAAPLARAGQTAPRRRARAPRRSFGRTDAVDALTRRHRVCRDGSMGAERRAHRWPGSACGRSTRGEGQLPGLRRRAGGGGCVRPRAVAVAGAPRGACGGSGGLRGGDGGVRRVAPLGPGGAGAGPRGAAGVGRVREALRGGVGRTGVPTRKPSARAAHAAHAAHAACAALRPTLRLVAVRSAETQGRAVARRPPVPRPSARAADRRVAGPSGRVRPRGSASGRRRARRVRSPRRARSSTRPPTRPPTCPAPSAGGVRSASSRSRASRRRSSGSRTSRRRRRGRTRTPEAPRGPPRPVHPAGRRPPRRGRRGRRRGLCARARHPRRRPQPRGAARDARPRRCARPRAAAARDGWQGAARRGAARRARWGPTDVRRRLFVGATSVIRGGVGKGGGGPDRRLTSLVARKPETGAAVAPADGERRRATAASAPRTARAIWAVTTKRQECRTARPRSRERDEGTARPRGQGGRSTRSGRCGRGVASTEVVGFRVGFGVAIGVRGSYPCPLIRPHGPGREGRWG